MSRKDSNSAKDKDSVNLDRGAHPSDTVLTEQAIRLQPDLKNIGTSDLLQQLHALQTRQCELERQNEALRRTQHELEAIRDHYFELYEFAPMGYCTVNKKGLILDANLRLVTLFGETRATLVNRPFSSLIYEDHGRFDQLCQQLMATGERQSCELRMLRQNGIVCWINLEASLRFDANDEPEFWLVLGDICQHKQTERELSDSQKLLNNIIDSTPAHIFAYDLHHRYTLVNQAMAEFSGMSKELLIGKNLHDIFPQSLADSLLATNRSILTKGEPVSFEEIVASSNEQQPRTMMTLKFPIRDTEGQIIGLGGVSTDISLLKQIEKKLIESEARLQAIIDASPVPTIMNDEKRQLVCFNPAFVRAFGYLPEEIPSLAEWSAKAYPDPAYRQWIIDYRQAARECAQQLESGQQPDDCAPLELIVRCKDGTDKHVLATMVRIGNFTDGSYLTVLYDITPLKQAEKKLQTSERRLQSIFEASPVPMALNDASEQITFLNPAFVQTFGYTLNEIPTLSDWWPQAYPDSEYRQSVADAWQAELERIKQTGEAFGAMKLTVKCKDGSDKYVLASAALIGSSFEDNHLVVLYDVTAIMQAQAALQASEQRFDSVVSALSEGIITVTREGVFSTWNQAAQRILGLTPSHLQDWTAIDPRWQVIYEDGTQCSPEAYPSAIAMRTGIAQSNVIIGVHTPDSSLIWLTTNAVPLFDAGDSMPSSVVVSFHDISAEKTAQNALVASLREKEALLREVHHRVKNNLQVITSLLRLESRRSTQAETKSVLTDMKGRIRSMALLHETLYRSDSFAGLDLGAYLKRLSNQVFRALVTQPGTIRLELDLTLVHVEMDQALPCGLILNELLTNALTHGFPGGHDGEIYVGLKDRAGHLYLSVRDTGVGLPADLELKGKQTLGLQLVSDLVRQLEGNLEIGPGPGSTFTITFTPSLARS